MLLIVSGVSCAGKLRTVHVINYNDKEMYRTEKDNIKYVCFTEYYEKEILNADIEETNPPKR